MKSVSHLSDFYYSQLITPLKKLEEDRQNLKHRLIVTVIIMSVLAAIAAYELKAYGIILFLYILTGGIVYKFMSKPYVSEFKQNIIKPLVSYIDSSLIYLQDSFVSQELFERSALFGKADKYSGNDFVKGKIEDINIEFSDVHAQEEYRDSKGRKHHTTIFQGLFIVCEFNKKFKGKTVVFPDSAQSIFGEVIGSFLQSKNLAQDELVKMDDPSFEKEFVVYSNDQIEARYILSHSLMKKILELKQKSKHPIYISFVNNHIHIAIYYDKDLFEPAVFDSLLDYKIAMEYVTTLHLAVGIVKELKLNQKLWAR